MVPSEHDARPCIVIAGGTWGFPHGMAAARRVALLGKALISEGYGVEVIHTTISEQAGKVINHEAEGHYQGIHFQYATGTTVASKHFLVRRLVELKGKWKTLSSIIAFHRATHLKGIIIYSRQLSTVAMISLAARVCGCPVFLELNEWPVARKGVSMGRRALAGAFCRFAPFLVDGFIVISRFIENKILKLKPRAGRAICYVPILVDSAQNEKIVQAGSLQASFFAAETYIVFSGSLDYQDAIRFILNAFGKVISRHPNCKLFITGKASVAKNKRDVEKMIEDRNLSSQTVLTGYLPDAELKHLQGRAGCLLAPLEKDDQSRARMPTKIAEYLITGIPVVTSSVGEITHYLFDRENAFVCPPEDADAYAKAICYALAQPEEARRIGAEGRRTALSCFDVRRYSAALAWLMEFRG